MLLCTPDTTYVPAKDCAGESPNTNTIDNTHLTTAATVTFADCMKEG